MADYHTYYVGDNGVLAHNSCYLRNTPDQDAVIQIAKEYKKIGMDKVDAEIMWSWIEETGLNIYTKAYHPAKFDSYQGGK